MRIANSLCLSLVAVTLGATLSFADAGTMTLADMIKYSDCIVVGRVVNAKVDGKHVAELGVTQVLKGDRSLKRVRFYAAPLWVCDISRAEENETGLFFLRRNFIDDPTENALSRSDRDGEPIFFITHSGRGRIIFLHLDGQDFVHAFKAGEVKFPGSLRYARYPNAANRNLGLITLVDVLSYVRKRV